VQPDAHDAGEKDVKKMRIIVGITGASGAIYGMNLLKALKETGCVETHLIISNAGQDLLSMELGTEAIAQARALAHVCHENNNLAAPVSSGTFKTGGMIIAPCSAKTLSAVARSYGDDLINRAADVVLKERRTLVLMFRETPLHLGHIENMALVTRMGGIIMPPVPAFYTKPATIDDIVNHTVGKALDLFGLEHRLYKPWGMDD
jgi:polyprenyl P-hydroxybenzoate/phenylacrylic acid decarboxylase-like protein